MNITDISRRFLVFSLMLCALQTTIAQEATTTPAKQVQRIEVMHTRPKWVLDTVYPYDITFCTIDSVAIPSKEALPKGNKPLIIAFWMTTCYPCRVELDAYTKKYDQWKQEADFDMVAISEDFPTRFAQIGTIAKAQKYPFPVFWDMNREFTQIMPGGLNGLPQVFVLDQDRKIVYHKRKYYTGDEDKLFEVVKSLQK